MPEGGRLNPGDTLDAPTIVFSGLPLDDPTTPEDDRQPKVIPGPWTVPYPDLAPTPSPSPSPSPSPGPEPTPPPPTNNTDPPPPDAPPPANNNDSPPPDAPPSDGSSNPPDSAPGEVTSEILQGIYNIASSYKNLQCDECAYAIENYLKEQKIQGKHIDLNTPQPSARYDDYIYDDSLPPNSEGISFAISENGHHEGVAVIVNGKDMVFDNHHPNGIPYEEWKKNLVFDSKIRFGAEFDESEYSF